MPVTTIPLEAKTEPKKKDITRARYTVFVCHGSDCVKNGAKETLKALRQNVRDAGLKGEVHVIKMNETRTAWRKAVVHCG